MNKTPPSSPKDMLGRSSVIPLTEALERLHHSLKSCPATDTESIRLTNCLDRVLGQSVKASEDLPPHPRSTMDGYAVKASETFGASESMPAYLTISGEVRMGETVDSGPGPQECFRIATGGFLPPGTDGVVMLEHTVDIDGNLIEVTKPVTSHGNILDKGDDVRQGDTLLEAGIKLRPQELGLLAGLGETILAVHKPVRVGIFSTGDEIVAHDQEPGPGKIRDMNAVHLAAMAQRSGAQTNCYGIVADQQEIFAATLSKALDQNDLVLFSGSSSVGVRDLGEQVIEEIAKPGIIVHGVAIKPGKPVIIGFAGPKPLFGLPGHPVSAAVAFNLFVRPAILSLSGLKPTNLPTQPTVQAKLMRNLNSAAGRTDFVRVSLQELDQTPGFAAYPVLGKSGALSTMVQADGYLVIEESSQGLYEHEIVEVVLF